MESGDSADSRVSRREMMTLAGTGAVGAVAIGGGSMVLSNNASATAQMEANDLEVSTPDGTLSEIIVTLNADCTYSDAQDVTFLGFDTTMNGETIHSNVSSIDSPVFSGRGEVGPTSGDFTYELGYEQNNPGINLFQQTDFEPSDFEVPEDGESETFDLNFETEFRVLTGSDKDSTETLTSSTTTAQAQLTVENGEVQAETSLEGFTVGIGAYDDEEDLPNQY